MDKAVYRETLVRAAEAVGGPHELCARLGVRMAQLEAWLRGDQYPPVHIFLGAVDILAMEGSSTARTSREAGTPPGEPTPR
jgi:hypothetical protein